MNSWTRYCALLLTLLTLFSGTAFAEGSRFIFGIHTEAKPIPAIAFNDASGNARTLDDFKGKYILLNVWATWCPPCRKELPDLQGLQRELGGDRFQVVALSTDAGRLVNVRDLYQELDLDETSIFIDETGTAMRALGIFAMPTTLLIDPEGQEIGRKPGPADWDSAEALKFFEMQIGGSDQ